MICIEVLSFYGAVGSLKNPIDGGCVIAFHGKSKVLAVSGILNCSRAVRVNLDFPRLYLTGLEGCGCNWSSLGCPVALTAHSLSFGVVCLQRSLFLVP